MHRKRRIYKLHYHKGKPHTWDYEEEKKGRAHIFCKGAGGCSCPDNLLYLDRFPHQVLDGHRTSYTLKHWKHRNKKRLEREPRAYRHKIAWGVTFSYVQEIRRAIRHRQRRMRGLTKCSKIGRSYD